MAGLRGGDASLLRNGGVPISWRHVDDGLYMGGGMSHNTPLAETLRGSTVRGVASGRVNQGNAFDFSNPTQPLPWHVQQEARPDDSYMPEPLPRQPKLTPRKFAGCRDRQLLAYLGSRNVSPGFLFEIDQFLQAHPEITSCPTGRDMITLMNSLSPLEAYRYFIKGYTRPARYNNDIIVSHFSLPAGFRPVSLRAKRDPELDDFFEGFEYRWDIIDRIDREVMAACIELGSGRSVPSGLRRLVCYANWGNPVDAYKWFEYNYQESYMPHRYLPEHVVLGDIPKPQDYTVPNPSGAGPSQKHMYVRFRMARANDEGVDVLDVLLSEYRTALVKRGFKRKEVENYSARAKERLDSEREAPTGVDIVDMLMDDLPGRSFSSHAAPRPRRFHVWTSAGRSSRIHVNRNRVTVRFANTTPQVAELGMARHILQRLYRMEEEAFVMPCMRPDEVVALSSRRANAERRYVNAIIRYMRDANQMTPLEASDLQRYFTRQRMEGQGPVNKAYLLGLYPRELN